MSKIVMDNLDNLIVRTDVCRRNLQDFYDSLIESSCSDLDIMHLVSSSLVYLNRLSFVVSMKKSASRENSK